MDIDDPEDVKAAARAFGTAMTSMTGAVGATVAGEMNPDLRAGASSLDRALVSKLDWIHTAFAAAVRETDSQTATTGEVTVFAANTLGNADIDGATVVRRAAT